MAGRGREATMPAWMTAGPMPGAPGGPPPPGLPQQMPGPPGGGMPLAPGMHGGPPSGMPPGSAPPPQQHANGPQGSGAPPPHLMPMGGLPFPPPGGMPSGPPGQMGPPPTSFPGAPPLSFPGMPPQGFPPPFQMPGGFPPPFLPPPGMLPPGMLPPPAAPQQLPGSLPPAAAPGQGAPTPAPGHPPAGAPGGPPPGSGPPPQQPGSKPAPDWTEHVSPDGRKYYYNAKLSKSSWEKPEELMSDKEKAELSSTAWKEYTATDGRKYYYNRITKESRWTPPEEPGSTQDTGKKSGGVQVVSLPAPSAQPQQSGSAAKAGASPPSAKEGSAEPGSAAGPVKVEYASKAEAKEAFKELLASVGCASDWTWEQAMRLAVADPRYSALKTLGEKKQAFNEFIQLKRNEEKEEERKRAKQAKEDFIRLIVDSSALKTMHPFRKAQELFEDDPRWKAVPERERQELFHEAQVEKREQEKEAARVEKKRRMAAYHDLLERTHGIKLSSEWRKVIPKLEGEPEYEALDKTERLEGFKAYMSELEKAEAEEKAKEREVVRRQERKARDAFRELLTAHKSQGVISLKTRWKEYAALVKGEDAYQAVERNSSGSRPRELFDDVIEGLEQEYDKAKTVLKELCKELDLAVSAVSVFDEWRAALVDKAGDRLAKVEEAHRRYWFEEQQGRAKEREVEEEGRRRRAKDRYASFLRHARGLSASTTWEDFERDNEQEKEFKDIDRADARAMFDEHLTKLKERAAGRDKRRDDGSSDEDRQRDREGRHKDSKKSKKSKSSRKHDRGSDDDEDRRSSKKKHKSKDKEREGERERDGKEGRSSRGGDTPAPAPSGADEPLHEAAQPMAT